MNAAQQRIEGEDRAERAEKLARLSSACRQAGAMVESGVDILSVTKILRAQSEDEDILRLCDRIDFDLKQGRALAQALADEPDLFSPFMVTLLRQGEERNTLPQAFARVSSALDAERNELLQALPAPASRPAQPPASHSGEGEQPQVLAGSQVSLAHLLDREQALARAEARWLRAASSIGAGLLAASAASEFLVALGLGARWQRPLSRALSAGVLALAAQQARKIEASHLSGTPQVLAAAPPTPPTDLNAEALGAQHPSAREQAEPEWIESARAEVASGARTEAAAEEALGVNAVYRGAPREDEEDEAPRRPTRRPRGEEEFD